VNKALPEIQITVVKHMHHSWFDVQFQSQVLFTSE